MFFMQNVKFRNYGEVYFELMNVNLNLCCGFCVGVLDV